MPAKFNHHHMIAHLNSPSGSEALELENLALAERKMRGLRRAGLFGEDTKGAVIRRACTADELRRAYRLVHDVFTDTGFLRPEPSGLRLRIFETTSETATFIAEKDGEVVGVISVVGDSPDLGLPSDAAFKPELDAMRASGSRLCELTNQAVTAAYRKSAVPTELMRCAIAHALRAGYQGSVAAVSPSHFGFYGLLGFESLGSERSYSEKLYDPVIALRLNLNRLRNPAPGLSGTAEFIVRFATETNPFLSLVDDWGKSARKHFLNAELLDQLFVQPGNFLAERSAAEMRILQRRWGRELLQVLTGNVDFDALQELATSAKSAPTEPFRELGFPLLPAPAYFWTPEPPRSVWKLLKLRLTAWARPHEDRTGHLGNPEQLWSYPSL